MEKFLILVSFPVISIIVVSAGIILCEISKYISGII